MNEKRRRPLLPVTRVALELLPTFKERKIPIKEFELRMNDRGCWGMEARGALNGLIRRGWLTSDNSHLFITEAGWDAATKGEGVPVQKQKPRSKPTKHTRLPAGLF